MNTPKVGQIVYSLNIGNAAGRGREQKLTPYVVTSVGRKYFKAAHQLYPRLTVQVEITTGNEKSQYCRNHQFYESPEEWELEKERIALSKKVADTFRFGAPYGFPLHKFRRIAAIIDEP